MVRLKQKLVKNVRADVTNAWTKLDVPVVIQVFTMLLTIVVWIVVLLPVD
jgi:hypothetical protein